MAAKTASSDTAYAAAFAGSIGSAVVALLLLVFDSIRLDPFFTPSQMGSLLFLGAEPSAQLPVRLDMVALYSLVHFAAFTALGIAGTLLYQRMTVDRRTTGLAAFLLSAQGIGVVLADLAFFPGLVSVVGAAYIGGAIVASAAVMTWFIRYAIGDPRPGEVPAYAGAGSPRA